LLEALRDVDLSGVLGCFACLAGDFFSLADVDESRLLELLRAGDLSTTFP